MNPKIIDNIWESAQNLRYFIITRNDFLIIY